MRQKMRHSVMPSERAASSMPLSTCDKAPRALRYMSGSEITAAASTVANQLKAIFIPVS